MHEKNGSAYSDGMNERDQLREAARYITELETRLRGSEVLLAAIVSTVGGYVAVPRKALTGASPTLLRRQDRPELDLTEFRYG